MENPGSAKEAEYLSAFQAQTRYTYKTRLGCGGFGQVVLAEDTWQQGHPQVAIKLLDRSQIGTDRAKYIRGEIENHAKLCHELVIQFIDVFLLPQWLCIVMEYAAGGSLSEYLKRAKQPLREDAARYLFRQLIIAVDYCHRRQIASRDIKLPNILLQPRENGHLCVKLCDFGHSKADTLSNADSVVGTIVYMAPEVLEKYLNPGSNKKYDSKLADVWACGVVLYIMLFGRFPWVYDSSKPLAEAVHDLLQSMRNTRWNSVSISAGCESLLVQMLTVYPQSRISLSAIMRDKWFAEGLPVEALQVNDACVNQQADLPTDEMRTRIKDVLDEAEAGMRTFKTFLSGNARCNGGQHNSRNAMSAETRTTPALVTPTPAVFSNP